LEERQYTDIWSNDVYLQYMFEPEAVEDWRQAVARVLIDPAYDGEVFQARITDTPARRDEMVRGEYTWAEEEYGEGEVPVKIVDVLDEDWVGVVGE
jgi:hypothetical protein